jgi:thiol:disulfide interchange protein DsbD
MAMLRSTLLVAAVLLLLPLSDSAQAQRGGSASKVDWTATATDVAPGKTGALTLTGDIADGWKMYALDSPPPSRGVSVSVESWTDGLSKGGPVEQSDPKRGYDPNFDKEVSYFEGTATLRVPVAVDASAELGERTVTGTVTFMVCTDEMCLPPTPASFETTLSVAEEAAGRTGSDAVTTAPPSGSADSGGTTQESSTAPERESAATAASSGSPASRADGLFGFLLLAIGAGAAALLTPCVFPMIPLTVSYFTKHTDNRSESMRMAGLYGLAIVLVFTGLGVAMSILVGAAGAQTIAANPWVNLFIGSVFVLFALSLLGLFELRLPSGLVNYFNQQSNEQSGYLGVLFMALTLTLVSFSCTAPFVGALLAAAAGGGWFYPLVGMAAFSATFALPFVGFALFPKGLDSLPQSGSWMNAVKVTLGFVELAAALKFLSNADLVWGTNLLSRPLAIAITVVLFTLAGLYLLGKLRMKHEPAVEGIGSLRLLTATAFLGTALYMLPGLFGARLGALDAYLPPRQASDVSLMTQAGPGQTSPTSESEFDWYTDNIDAAFEQAKQVNKPVFIDFTGYTCTNCRDMEANVFPKPPVAERFRSNFVLLRLYTDAPPKGTEFQQYQLKLTGTTALPTYAIVAPSDRSLISHTSGTASVENFASFLERGATQFANEQTVAAR